MAEFAQKRANSAITTLALGAKLCKSHTGNIFAKGKFDANLFFRPVVDQDGAVHEHFLDLNEVREKTGHGQATAIQSVDQNGLDNKSIAFQSFKYCQ